jgi:hypothetical protein
MANSKRHFTLADLQKSKVAAINQKAFEDAKKPEKKKGGAFPKQPCLQVQWMWSNLAYWSLATGIEVVREHKFCEFRKWRFDFFIKGLNTAIEYEGIFSEKSRHTSKMGYAADCEKYNQAAKMGIKVLRFNAKDYKNVIKNIDQILNQNNNA